MKPYAELLEFSQPNHVMRKNYTKVRDTFKGLNDSAIYDLETPGLKGFHYDPERIVEFAGRLDYGDKSLEKFGDKSIIKRWVDAGHESMLEMADATFYIECSRVVSHELVRHRLCSFQQESQRYVKYDDVDGDCFYIPEGEYGPDIESQAGHALVVYKNLRDKGVPAQLARYVLPNAMKTRLVMKANLREWRHIVKLRTHPSAQPEMQELMNQVKEQLLDIFPNLMYDTTGERGVR